MISYHGSPYLKMPADRVVGKPRVIRVRGFNEKQVHNFRLRLQYAIESGQPVIPVVVDSYGGDAYGLFAIIDLLEWAKFHTTIATVCEGKAMSAGALVLSCGEHGHRYVAPNAAVMVHEGSGFSSGKTSEQMASAAESKRVSDQYFSLLSKYCRKPRAFFDRLLKQLGNADAHMDAETAVKIGVADQVGLPQLAVQVEVSFAFGVPTHGPPPKKRSKRGKGR